MAISMGDCYADGEDLQQTYVKRIKNSYVDSNSKLTITTKGEADHPKHMLTLFQILHSFL